jgi:glucosamine kinase
MVGHILGVDGGQTSTKLLIASTAGEVLWCGQRASVSRSSRADDGPDAVEQRLAHLLRQVLAEQRWDQVVFDVVAMGMTGGEPGSPKLASCTRAAQTAVQASRVVVVHDAVTGLLGASAGQPGIVVIAGGGAVAHGFTADGRSATSSGWGYIIGDEGSAWTVGRSALNAVFRAIDGRGSHTILVERIFARFGITDPIQLKFAIFRQQIDFNAVAALPPLVADVAAEGDAVARAILDKAGQDLAESAVAVARRLGLTDAPVNVYPTGGLFKERRFILPAFGAAVQAALPQARITPPAYDQVVGTLFLGLRELGRPIDDALLHRLAASWEEKRHLLDSGAAAHIPSSERGTTHE